MGYTFGFEMVIIIASCGRYRMPGATGLIDPKRKGLQNILLRQVIRDFIVHKWAGEVIVEANGGWAANQTCRVIEQKKYRYVFVVSGARRFTDGKCLGDLVCYLPKNYYHRVASYNPEGRRKDY